MVMMIESAITNASLRFVVMASTHTAETLSSYLASSRYCARPSSHDLITPGMLFVAKYYRLI